MILGVSSCSLGTLRQFHVDVCLIRSLRLCHKKINLPKAPVENDAKDYLEPDGKSGDNRCICLKVVHPMHLFSTMKIQPGFVLNNLVLDEVTLALHCPDGRYDLCLFCNILLLD
jgi:hypothetical protein